MKHCFHCLNACAAALVLAGCASPEKNFLGVSDAADASGGILIFRAGKDSGRISLPGLNYLIGASSGKRLFGSRSVRGKGGYAVLQRKDGEVSAEFFEAGVLPCHLAESPDGKFLYLADYSAGTLIEVRIDENGRPLSAPRILKHLSPPGRKPADPSRQESAHPHCAVFDPEGRNLYSADLGLDEIFVYAWNPGKGIGDGPSERIACPPGAGPRHLAFSPDGKTLYCANELDGTMTAFRRGNGKWELFATLPTLTEPSAKRNYPGAIRVSPSGRFLLVSNRGADSVAVFGTTPPDGTPKLLRTVPCGGAFPRDMIFSPDGRTLATANQFSGTYSLFRFSPETGNLEFIGEMVPEGGRSGAVGVLFGVF